MTQAERNESVQELSGSGTASWEAGQSGGPGNGNDDAKFN